MFPPASSPTLKTDLRQQGKAIEATRYLVLPSTKATRQDWQWLYPSRWTERVEMKWTLKFGRVILRLPVSTRGWSFLPAWTRNPWLPWKCLPYPDTLMWDKQACLLTGLSHCTTVWSTLLKEHLARQHRNLFKDNLLFEPLMLSVLTHNAATQMDIQLFLWLRWSVRTQTSNILIYRNTSCLNPISCAIAWS